MNIIQIQIQFGTIGALDQYIIAPLQDVAIPIVQMVLALGLVHPTMLNVQTMV
jgi:hypothetical protein